jgi:hypothetical protein
MRTIIACLILAGVASAAPPSAKEFRFSIEIEAENGRENESVQNLVEYLQSRGCRDVRWHRNQPQGLSPFWLVSGSATGPDDGGTNGVEIAPPNIVQTGPTTGPKVTILHPGIRETGYVNDLTGPWYRPDTAKVYAGSLDGMCIALGVERSSLLKLTPGDKRRIAGALVLYRNSGGDAFGGSSEKTR